MSSEDFLAALAPAITDAEVRARFLADPKAVLAAAGLDFPEWFTVTAREGDAVELTITLPDLVQSNSELTDMDLATVSAGFGGSFPHSCAEFNFGSTCALCGRLMPR